MQGATSKFQVGSFSIIWMGRGRRHRRRHRRHRRDPDLLRSRNKETHTVPEVVPVLKVEHKF